MHTHPHPSTLTLAPAPSPYVLTLNLICFLSSYPFPPVSHLPHPCPASPSLFSLSPVSLTASLISLTLPLPCLYHTLSIMALSPSPSLLTLALLCCQPPHLKCKKGSFCSLASTPPTLHHPLASTGPQAFVHVHVHVHTCAAAQAHQVVCNNQLWTFLIVDTSLLWLHVSLTDNTHTHTHTHIHS
jgi:hypothetical protein